MAQEIISRTVCDWCLHMKGKHTVFTRSMAEDVEKGGPAFQKVLRVGALTKTVDMCPDCDREILEPLRQFLDRHGVDVVGRGRIGRPSKGSALPTTPTTPVPAAPAPAAPVPVLTTPVPVAPIPDGLFRAPALVVTPPAANGHAVTVAPTVKASAAPMYPCPLCDGVTYGNTHMLADHAKIAHGLMLDQIVGADCHFCGKAMGTYNKLASHFGSNHRHEAHSGRTLVESMILARDNGDPHGTVAARTEVLAEVLRERMANNGTGSTHTTIP